MATKSSLITVINNLSTGESISFGEFTVTKREEGFEVNGGTVLIKGKYGYLCFNLIYQDNPMDGVETIQNWGNEDIDMTLAKVPSECTTEFDVYHLEDEDSFSIDTGFYGVIKFSVMTMEELEKAYKEHENKLVSSTEEKHPKEVKIVYWTTVGVMYIQSTDGLTVSCLEASTTDDFHTDSPYRKIILHYGDTTLAVEALSHFTKKMYRIHHPGHDLPADLSYQDNILYLGDFEQSTSIPAGVDVYNKEVWEKESERVRNFTFAKKVPHHDHCPFTVCL